MRTAGVILFGVNALLQSMRRVKISTGVELDVAVHGDPDNPPIVFLHGFPESHRTWRHQLAALSDQYYCIAPDQRGYRGSSKPSAVSAYSTDKLTADIFALADAFGIEQFTIAGHDWGGAVAWSVALNGQPAGFRPQWAGRVTRAMIANAPHPCIYQRVLINDPTQRASAQYIRMFRDTALDSVMATRGLFPVLQKAMNWVKPPAMEQEEYDDLRAGWQHPDTAFGMINWYRASQMVVPAIGEVCPVPDWAAADFPKLEIPTLLVWAMQDKALPPSNIEGIEAFVPNIQIERIEDCGHFVTWEQPQAVIAAMRAFLSQTG